MKVVVVGGTGFLGRHIAHALIRGDHDVTVLGRDPRKVTKISELAGAGAVRGDVTDPHSLDGVFDGADAVVGAAQFPNHPMEVPRRGLTYDRYDRAGTENLLAAARRARVDRYVYISGAGADPTSPKSWFRAKGRAEKTVKESGLEFCILRPSWAYGPGDRALNRFAQIARVSPVIPQLGSHRQLIQPVYAGDIGFAVARMFERDAWGRTLEIGCRKIMTMNEVITTMLDVLRKRRAVVPVPARLLKMASTPLRVLPKPPMTPVGVDFATHDGLVDIDELVATLGFEPLSLRAGLARYLGGPPRK